jgi:hypothetical protein
MRLSPVTLLRDRAAFWTDAATRRLEWADLLPLVGFIILACGAYGAVLAGWRSPLLALYVAAKLPFLFLATIGVVSLFNWMLAASLGAGLSFKSTLFLVFASMTMASWLLLSLVPVALFFVATGVLYAGTNTELRFAHNGILVTHILILAAAGVAGNAVLLGGLRRLVRPQCPTGVLFASWLASFAFVGCQMSWILRPFVGSPFYPIVFMRPDCLERNFYEFVFTEVVPFLLTGG